MLLVLHGVLRKCERQRGNFCVGRTQIRRLYVDRSTRKLQREFKHIFTDRPQHGREMRRADVMLET